MNNEEKAVRSVMWAEMTTAVVNDLYKLLPAEKLSMEMHTCEGYPLPPVIHWPDGHGCDLTFMGDLEKVLYTERKLLVCFWEGADESGMTGPREWGPEGRPLDGVLHTMGATDIVVAATAMRAWAKNRAAGHDVETSLRRVYTSLYAKFGTGPTSVGRSLADRQAETRIDVPL
jgi:hypothetical protein